MKKLYVFICVCLIIISSVAFSNISHAQITNPIPEKIEKSKLAITLQEIVQIPKSGTARERVARLNFLTHAGDGSGRLFVNDMRGKLYVIINGKASLYMNLKNLVSSGFSYDTGQQGFGYFVFHPEFSKNGIFYTVHSEKKITIFLIFRLSKELLITKVIL